MYRDKTLIPTEAVRLLALGLLADAPRRYRTLATEIRHFTSHVTGPSLDLLGPSIELLRYEGLAEPVEDKTDPGVEPDADSGDQLLRITQAGHEELTMLLGANVRAPIDGFAKLVIALKFRFLHLLSSSRQAETVDGLIELYRAEQARLVALREQTATDGHALTDWLDHDIALVESRIGWLTERRAALTSSQAPASQSAA